MLKIDSSLMFDPVKISEMAGKIEAAGFDGAYTFEGQNDPFISLAAAALNTRRMDLMTLVAVAFALNPMSLAYQANDLQMLSQGRFILGLGTQVKAHIERRFNMLWSRPAARMREFVQAIREIWRCWDSGDKLKFEGEFYQHTLMSPTFSPAKNPHGMPKIYIAGVGPLMTQVAAATGLNEERLQAAIFSARSQIAFYASTPAYLPVLKAHGWEAMQPAANKLSREGKWLEMAELVDDDILNTFALVGEPLAVARGLVERFDGKVERVSPMIYSPDTELLQTLVETIRGVQQ